MKDPDWSSLPAELLSQILIFLTPPDLCRVSLVHTRWRQAALDQSLWRRLFIRSWGHFSFAQPFLVAIPSSSFPSSSASSSASSSSFTSSSSSSAAVMTSPPSFLPLPAASAAALASSPMASSPSSSSSLLAISATNSNSIAPSSSSSFNPPAPSPFSMMRTMSSSPSVSSIQFAGEMQNDDDQLHLNGNQPDEAPQPDYFYGSNNNNIDTESLLPPRLEVLSWKAKYALIWEQVFRADRVVLETTPVAPTPGGNQAGSPLGNGAAVVAAITSGNTHRPVTPKVLFLFASRAVFEESLARSSVPISCFSDFHAGPPPSHASPPPPPTPSSSNISLSSSPLFPQNLHSGMSTISPSALSSSLSSVQHGPVRLLPPSASWKVVSEAQGCPRTFEVLILEDHDQAPGNGIPIVAGTGSSSSAPSSYSSSPFVGSFQSYASFAGSTASRVPAVDFEKAIRESLARCDMLVFVTSMESRLSSSSTRILETLKGFLVPPPSASSSTSSSLSSSPVFPFSLPSSPGTMSPLSSSPTFTAPSGAFTSAASSRLFVSPLYVDCDSTEFSHFFHDVKRKLPTCDISYFWTYEAITRGMYDRSFLSAIKGGSFRFFSPTFPFLSVFQAGLLYQPTGDFRWIFQQRDPLLCGSFFFQGRFLDRIADAQVAFDYSNWSYLSDNTKRELALKYAREVLFPHLTILDQPTKEFRDLRTPFKPAFAPPKAKIVRESAIRDSGDRDSSDSDSESLASSAASISSVSSSSSLLIPRTRRSSSLNIGGKGSNASTSVIVVKCWVRYKHLFSSGMFNANQYLGHIHLQLTTTIDLSSGRIRSITTDKTLLGSDFGFPMFESITEWNPVKRDKFPKLNVFL